MRLFSGLKGAIGALLFATMPLAAQAQTAASQPATIPVPHLDPVRVFETMTGESGVAQDDFTFVIAHRGFHSEPGCAENSFCAIKAAYEAGADGIELDVKLSSDNKTVLGHDNTVGRELVDWGGAPAVTSWSPFYNFPLVDSVYRFFAKLPFLLKFGGPDDPKNPQRSLMLASAMMGHKLRDQFDQLTDDGQIDVQQAMGYIAENYPMMIWLDVKNIESLNYAAADVEFARDDWPGSNVLKYVGFKLPLSIVEVTEGNPSKYYNIKGLKYLLVF